MKNLSFILISTFLFFNVLKSQTTPISYKSHSAAVHSIPIAADGGFGNPGPILMKIVYLNDSMIIEVKQDGFRSYTFNDTIWNHPVYSNPQISTDSLQKLYPNMIFEGFKKRKVLCTDPSIPPSKSAPYRRKRSGRILRGAIQKPTKSPAFYWGIVGIIGTCVWAGYRSKKANV